LSGDGLRRKGEKKGRTVRKITNEGEGLGQKAGKYTITSNEGKRKGPDERWSKAQKDGGDTEKPEASWERGRRIRTGSRDFSTRTENRSRNKLGDR